MVIQVFNTFIVVLGRVAALLFNLPISDGVTLGSFLVASGILGAVIAVVFVGLRAFVSLFNNRRVEDAG